MKLLSTFLLAFLAVSAFGQVNQKKAASCYEVEGKDKSFTVGWFSKKTFNADLVCVEGSMKGQGHHSIKLKFYSNKKLVAEYEGSVERWNDKAGRFTLADGEPEPTQYEAKFKGDSLVEIDGRKISSVK